MTIEDRKQAERLAIAYVKQFGVGKNFGRPLDKLPNYGKQDFLAGYAACAEKMRAEMKRMEDHSAFLQAGALLEREARKIVEAERARAQKLIAEIKTLLSQWYDTETIKDDIEAVIWEYEASK